MAVPELKEILLTLIPIVGVFVVSVMVFKIFLKSRRGSSPKKKRKESKALETDTSDPESNSVFNTIMSTKRIASDLRRRGIDTGAAESLIKKAEDEYGLGREGRAKLEISEAKEILLRQNRDWDEKTGFNVVPEPTKPGARTSPKKAVDMLGKSSQKSDKSVKPDEVFPELKKAEKKKPDNYLPSKFTISLAGSAIDNAEREGANTDEAKRYLIEAKTCFDREDYDEAFNYSLCSKREAESLLGVTSSQAEDKKQVLSDLATLASDTDELMICTTCGFRRIPYICIESDSGEEATCKECYELTMGKITETKLEPPPPPPPPPDDLDEEQDFCPNCGAMVKGEDVFCGKCGKPVKEELKCVGCGEKVELGDMFCRKCGARLVT